MGVALAGQEISTVSAPVWSKPDHFWYRRAVAGGRVWFNVDALHGVKEPLFDHQRLAIELTIRTGVEYTPLTLPFADPASRFVVKYDGSNAYVQEGAMAVEFVHGAGITACPARMDGSAERYHAANLWPHSKRHAGDRVILNASARVQRRF